VRTKWRKTIDLICIVKITVVLADGADYDEMNRVWREFFPTDPPARTTCAMQLSNGKRRRDRVHRPRRQKLVLERAHWSGSGVAVWILD
jgi:hypothetical protein